jgi:hypothetical protein
LGGSIINGYRTIDETSTRDRHIGALQVAYLIGVMLASSMEAAFNTAGGALAGLPADHHAKPKHRRSRARRLKSRAWR